MKTKKLLLFAVCLIFGLNIKAQNNYHRITDLSEIQNGSAVIIAARHDSLSATSYYAMSNVAAGKPQGVLFSSISTGVDICLPTEITDNEMNFCWTVGITEGCYTFVNVDGDMLGYGSSGTDFVKNGTNSTWSITASISGDGTSVPNHNAFVITNVGVSNRSVAFRKYNSGALYEKFAPYSNSSSNIGGSNYMFYLDIFVKSSEITPVVSMPTFNPPGGDYSTAQNVSISCETEDVMIYYTLDGTEPTEESMVYSNPIEVSNTTTIKAFAKKDGMLDSGISSATYNIVETVTLSFYENGILSEMVSIAKGDVVGELPAADLEGFSFSGWTYNEISGYVNTAPEMITPSTIVNEDMNLYAVFSVSKDNCIESELSSFSRSDVAVIAISKDEKYYAMSQIEGSNGQPTVYELTVSNGNIVNAVPDDIKWNIAYNAGDMVIYPNGNDENWLYCNSGSNNNSVRIGTNADNNVFELKTVEINEVVYPDYLYNKSTERFVGAYYDGDVAIDWRAYKITASGAFPTNIRNQTYHFYKYGGICYYCTNVDVPQTQTISENTTWENVSVSNTIIVEDGATLTINGIIGCEDASKLIIKDGGQLVHNNVGVMATLEKKIEGYGSTNGSWYTISSPLVGNTNLSDIDELMPVAGNYDLYRYDEPTSVWQNEKETSNGFTKMETGRGYLYANEYDATISFVGELNSDDVNYYLSKTQNIALSGFHLIGNPFTHNIYKGNGASIDDKNLAKGYYSLLNSGAWGAKISNETPITPGQSILVKTTQEGNIVIKKTTVQPSQKSMMDVLSITVGNGNYEDNAYVMFDEGVALEKINHQNQEVPLLYVPVENVNYAIAMFDDEVREIPLSFEARTMGEYTISIDVENKDFDNVYLVDNLTGNVTNMLVDEYEFIATTNDDPSRFVLKLFDIDSINEYEDNGSLIYVRGGELIIDNVSDNAKIDIYDILGRRVCGHEMSHNETRKIITIGTFKTGVYIVRISSDDIVEARKILVK